MSSPIVKSDPTGEALYAARSYRAGEVVVDFGDAVPRAERDAYTVETPSGGHIFHPALAKVSHSCEPNCRVRFEAKALVASRPIAAGEAISFDYLSTERRISAPFPCLCGCKSCRGRIG